MEEKQVYLPLGRYIQISKEKNTQLLATRHFGLSASEGLVELPLEKGKADKRSYWTLREGQIAIDLIDLGQVGELAAGRHSFSELGIISNIHTVFDVMGAYLNSKYLSLILKSQKTKNILLHYACHGVKMALPWEDFCNLPIRVPPPSSQEELVRKYSIVEKVIKLKKQINETLEKWMECYYHILFDNLPEDQLERKRLGELLTIVGGGYPTRKFPENFVKKGGIPWIQIKDITNQKSKFIARGAEDLSWAGFDSCDAKLVPEDSILFTAFGTIGKLAIASSSLSFSNKIWALNYCSEEKSKNIFLYFFLKFKRDYFLTVATKTTMGNLKHSDLNNLVILGPPKTLISQFNQVCEPFFQLQKANEQEIRELLKLQKYFIELTN